MSTNKKVLSIVVAMILTVSLISIIVFIYNFKSYSIKNTKDKAVSIAQNVRDGLTAHMVNGTMDKRKFFLENIARHQNVENFHLLRAKSVIEQYGKGFYGEARATELEKKVVQSRKLQTELIETIDKVILKVAIPYIANSSSIPNCISCHNAKEGDLLGVISMDLEVSSTRMEGILIASKILLIVLVIVIISIITANYYIRPYIKLFDDLENGISQAYRGDFSYQIETKLKNEAGKVAQRLNELSEIYKFKKTIELDENKDIIYGRIIHILQTKFNISKFIFFEINNKTKLRSVIFDSVDLNETVLDDDANLCRAFRTSNHVYSSDFEDICLNCRQKHSEYMCFIFKIDDNNSLVLNIQASKKDEILRIKEFIPVITNYLEMAKPVIESKILLDILKDTTLRDPMTKLYNRRFLNELLDSNIPSRHSQEHIHAILMIDIDFFKKVNDSYGHDIGDGVIKKLAQIMKDSIRSSDMPVRFGGEEFLVLLLNTTREKSLDIANTINEKFASETFLSQNETFKKTLSVGIASYPKDADTLWKAIKYADEALYEAKNSGRNKVVEFELKMHKAGDDY
jgi:diguanylate cyclase (GGDEF)-like protein